MLPIGAFFPSSQFRQNRNGLSEQRFKVFKVEPSESMTFAVIKLPMKGKPKRQERITPFQIFSEAFCFSSRFQTVRPLAPRQSEDYSFASSRKYERAKSSRTQLELWRKLNRWPPGYLKVAASQTFYQSRSPPSGNPQGKYLGHIRDQQRRCFLPFGGETKKDGAERKLWIKKI